MSELSNTAREFVSVSADNIIAIDDFVADNRETFADLYMELLQDPDRRNDDIEAEFVNYFFTLSKQELGDDSMLEYWKTVAASLDQSFDDLNERPPNERGDVFHTVRKIMSAASWKQAFIESGIALDMVERGLDMGNVVAAFGKVINLAEFTQGTGIREVIKEKLAAREVGTGESPFKNRAVVPVEDVLIPALAALKE